MPTSDQMRVTLAHYAERLTAGDVDAIVDLYAADGSIEDPVGTPGHQGSDAIRAFYASNAPGLRVEICGPICCAANHSAVMPLLARLSRPGRPDRYIDAIDVVEFDPSGLIRSLRAYWNPAEMRKTIQPALA